MDPETVIRALDTLGAAGAYALEHGSAAVVLQGYVALGAAIAAALAGLPALLFAVCAGQRALSEDSTYDDGPHALIGSAAAALCFIFVAVCLYEAAPKLLAPEGVLVREIINAGR